MIKTPRNYITILLLLCAFKSTAQPIHVTIPKYDFIHEDQAQLIVPASDTLLNNFFQKLSKLMLFGEGQINVLHMGGSHIQADVYSNRLRQLLGSYYPEQQGARGLIFPYRIAKTNGPPDFRADYTGDWTSNKNVSRELSTKLGLMGMSVSTSDTTASFQITFDRIKNLPQHFTRIKLFNEIDSSSFQPYWIGNDSVKFTSFPEKGYTLIELPRFYDTISIGFKKEDSLQHHYILYGMYLESDEPGITYNSVGVNGASTTSYLKCELFEQQVKEVHPDLVFFGIGINDAHNNTFTQKRYEDYYRQIIKMIQASNPNVMLVFITNNDSYSYSRINNKNAEAVEKAMYNLAKEYNGAVWNMFRVMGGYRSATIWRANNLMKHDRIHFNREGYNLMGDLIFNALMEKYGNYLMRNH